MLFNLERAQQLIADANLDAVVLATPTNVIYGSDIASEYLLGGLDDYTHAVVIPASSSVSPAFIVPDNDMPHIVESATWLEELYPYGNAWCSIGRFMGETLEAHVDTAFRDRLQSRRRSLGGRQVQTFIDALQKAIADRNLTAARIGCDDMPLARMLEERNVGANMGIPYVRQLVRRIRAVKTPSEVELLTKAATINANAVMKTAKQAREGMLETDLIRSWHMALTEQDAQHAGERGMFFGTGDASTFYLPSDQHRTLRKGDSVIFDCIGSYKRYCMDVARTAIVGEPSKELLHRHCAVDTALSASLDMTRAGVHTRDIAALIEDTIDSFGLKGNLTSSLTHGIGLVVFEFPNADGLANGFPLEEGMSVNTEVFYRDPYLGGFHMEDTVVVTQSGHRILSSLPRDLITI
jgi:Xaa-Pro dipeptidase